MFFTLEKIQRDYRLSDLKSDRLLGDNFDRQIPEPTDFDEDKADARQIRYVHLQNTRDITFGRQETQRIQRDPNYVPPEELNDFISRHPKEAKPASFDGVVEYYAELAKVTFDAHGSHVPMLMLFDEDWNVCDFVSTAFQGQASKYIFWRSIAERVKILKPQAIIWIAEEWMRQIDRSGYKAIRNLPIIGEMLSVVGMDKTGRKIVRTWEISRSNGKPTLVDRTDVAGKRQTIFFLVPIERAFEAIYGIQQ